MKFDAFLISKLQEFGGTLPWNYSSTIKLLSKVTYWQKLIFFVESLSRIAVAPLRVLIAQLSMEKAAATNVSETVPKFLASIGFYFACTV
jgi:hypothetical protein